MSLNDTTRRALGHTVNFGGMDVSGLETGMIQIYLV